MARYNLLFVFLIAVAAAGCSISGADDKGVPTPVPDAGVTPPPPPAPPPENACDGHDVGDVVGWGCNPYCDHESASRWVCSPSLDADCVTDEAACHAVTPPPPPPPATDAGTPPPPPPPPPPGTTAPDRIAYPDPMTWDGRDVTTLRDWPGFTWYNTCWQVPALGVSSTHPWTAARPEWIAVSPIGDDTLNPWLPEPYYTAELPITGDVKCVAFLIDNSRYAEFNARYRYAGRPFFAVGQNRADEAFIRMNGHAKIFRVVGGHQTLVGNDGQMVMAANCDPASGGRLHVAGTHCSPDVCTGPGMYACTD